MEPDPGSQPRGFRAAVQGLLAGDFSRLEPLFRPRSADDEGCAIRDWHRQGLFAREPAALAEAVACACFNGCTDVVEYLLAHGVDPAAGNATGLDGFHWAVNRGQLATVELLLRRGASLETRSRYGGTVLGTALWSAVHEPRADHLRIIEALLSAGARPEGGDRPTGDARVDELLRRRFGA